MNDASDDSAETYTVIGTECPIFQSDQAPFVEIGNFLVVRFPMTHASGMDQFSHLPSVAIKEEDRGRDRRNTQREKKRYIESGAYY